MRREVERMILDNGGIIYGGHVRDVILSHLREDKKDVVSADIDCYMVAHSIEDFLADIKSAKLCTKLVFERKDAKAYLPSMNIPNNILTHLRLQVSCYDAEKCKDVIGAIQDVVCEDVQRRFERRIHKFAHSLIDCGVDTLMLDIMVADCSDFYRFTPPFGNIDFECNGLILTKNGIQMSAQLYPSLSPTTRMYKLEAIVEDINAMRAVYVSAEDATDWRVKKMLSKGWTIPLKFIESAVEAGERCIICHDDFGADDVHCKLRCCNARYHKKCIMDALVGVGEFAVKSTGKCIMCKQSTRAYEECRFINA